MKRFALIVLVVLALAAPALAQQVGTLGIFSDDQGNSCDLTDAGGGSLVTTYVVHKIGPGDGTTGVRFRIEPPAGATWSYAAFSTTFTPVGQANVDLAIGYGGCQTLTFSVGSALWVSLVAAPACSWVTIKEGLTGVVLATDCAFQEWTMPTPGQAIANPNVTCPCDIAVQSSTWGQVKALYR